MKRKQLNIVMIMGLALFATFFGAGNLIFPPYLGRNVGSSWMTGFIGFFIMDVGLATMGVLAVVMNQKGSIDGVVDKIGHIPGVICVTAIILCIGPGLCIPRTAATTYELGVKTMIPSLNHWVFGAIFFAIVLALTIRPNKVVDIVGKFLTPLLLAVMVIMIIRGIVAPIGHPVHTGTAVPLKEGMLSGYQTMDGIGGMLMTLMLITAAKGYGYTDKKSVSSLIAKAGIVSGVLLMLVYGGLTFLGATTSGSSAFAGLEQAPLLVAITNRLMGGAGVGILAVIVFLACLTTAIGLTSVAGNYFEELSGGRLKYSHLVVAMTIFSYLFSNVGLAKIISISAPILQLMYPTVLVLVVMSFFEKVIKDRLTTGFAAYTALFYEILALAASMGAPFGFVNSLPLAKFGLGWILPALIGGIIGSFFHGKRYSETIAEVDSTTDKKQYARVSASDDREQEKSEAV
ncbi:MAG: branched-chain amino acid transport system II carrier protein [Eubacterium sp.]